MARPKKVDSGKALERLEDSFWKLLEENQYQMITIKLLTSEAKINHNSFYYYFSNIDEMARVFFYKRLKFEMLPDFTENLRTMLETINDKDSGNYKNWMRITLFTCRGSEYLVSIFKEALRNRWAIFNPEIDITKLENNQLYLLDFLESGIIKLIAKSRENNTLEPMFFFVNSPLAKAVNDIIKTWDNSQSVI
ncbi:MAG: TetR/AcrR family transcriptional regulator [Sphaerochaetaceae bacterium]|nr:TetR/AcrR family transcriptional regulator [Sphaerochaetaceae bacterium]